MKKIILVLIVTLEFLSIAESKQKAFNYCNGTWESVYSEIDKKYVNVCIHSNADKKALKRYLKSETLIPPTVDTRTSHKERTKPCFGESYIAELLTKPGGAKAVKKNKLECHSKATKNHIKAELRVNIESGRSGTYYDENHTLRYTNSGAPALGSR
jgi:hypothetical protein